MDSPRRLTVLQVLPALRAGGVERGVLEVAQALVAAGHRSLVISAGGPMVKALTSGGSEHFQLPVGAKSLRALACIGKLRSFLQAQNVDVVDYHSRLPGWVVLAAWKTLPLAQRPALISTLHGLHSTNFYSSVMCRGQYVVVVSETVREYVKQHFGFAFNDHLHLIHRGVDSQQFPRGYRPSSTWLAQLERDYPQTVGKSLVTIVGRITRLKGHRDYLTLLRKLLDRGLSVHGLVVGGFDPKKQHYQQEILCMVSDLGLSSHVSLLGQRSDLKDLYAASHCVMSLSTTPESFGRTVAESLAVGTPVVGYDHGGVSEILTAQFPEGKVPIGELDQLVSRTEWVISHDCSSLIRANPFQLDQMLENTLRLYVEAANGRQVLGNSSRRAA